MFNPEIDALSVFIIHSHQLTEDAFAMILIHVLAVLWCKKLIIYLLNLRPCQTPSNGINIAEHQVINVDQCAFG